MNMRDLMILAEGKAIPVEGKSRVTGTPFTTNVWVNPSFRDCMTALANSREKQLRGLSTDEGNFIWDAYDATHLNMEEALRITGRKTSFWIIKDGDGPNSPDWTTADDDIVRNGLRLLLGYPQQTPSAQALVRMFGDQP